MFRKLSGRWYCIQYTLLLLAIILDTVRNNTVCVSIANCFVIATKYLQRYSQIAWSEGNRLLSSLQTKQELFGCCFSLLSWVPDGFSCVICWVERGLDKLVWNMGDPRNSCVHTPAERGTLMKRGINLIYTS